jgi:hypothetical protein
MEENKFELNHSYLINKYTRTFLSVTILLITDKAYHVRWNNGMNSSSTSWESKEILNEYNIVEDITEFMNHENLAMNPSSRNVIIKRILCPGCYGSGVIPDTSSTAGNKLCPQCLGGKTVPDFRTIL